MCLNGCWKINTNKANYGDIRIWILPDTSGKILKDEIEARGISQRMLAKQMGLTYSVLNEILNARRPMTEKTALLFEAALGIDAEPLMRLQMKYNMQIARKDIKFSERLTKVRKI